MSSKLTKSLRESDHPIVRAMIAEDILPGTENDEIIGWAIRAERTMDAEAYARVGKLIAPSLATGKPDPLRRLIRDLKKYHRHQSPDRRPPLAVLAEIAMDGRPMTNGVGEPMSVLEVIGAFEARGIRITENVRKAFESWVRRNAPVVGIPIKGEPGNPTRRRKKPS